MGGFEYLVRAKGNAFDRFLPAFLSVCLTFCLTIFNLSCFLPIVNDFV